MHQDGSSSTWHQPCNTQTALQPLQWIFKMLCVKWQSLIQSHIGLDCHRSAWKQRIALYCCHCEVPQAHLKMKYSTTVNIIKNLLKMWVSDDILQTKRIFKITSIKKYSQPAFFQLLGSETLCLSQPLLFLQNQCTLNSLIMSILLNFVKENKTPYYHIFWRCAYVEPFWQETDTMWLDQTPHQCPSCCSMFVTMACFVTMSWCHCEANVPSFFMALKYQ